MEHKYYLVSENGKSMDAIKEWQRLYREAVDRGWNLGKEIGALEIIRAGQHITCFHFDKHPGKGWRIHPEMGDKYYKPHRGTKAGKAMAARIDAINIPDSRTFSRIIGGGFMVFKDGYFSSTSFEVLTNKFVISVPIGSEESFIPPDTTPLKLSEYYALKEAAEVAAEEDKTTQDNG